MRSPGKNLDLKLGSVNEEESLDDSLAEPVVAAAAEAAQVKQDQTKRPVKRRRSLRLQEKQAMPNKAESTEVVKGSSNKKGNKKRRQSGHNDFATISAETETVSMDFVSADEMSKSTHSSSKQKSRTKRRQSDYFGVAKSSAIETLIVTQEAHDELALALNSITSFVDTSMADKPESDADEMKESDDINSLDDDDSPETEKENVSSISATKNKKGRRDTFDLSRKRGLRAGPSALETACTPGYNKDLPLDVHEMEKVKPAGITIDTSKHHDDLFKKKLFITPKNSEVAVDVGAEISSTLKDDPNRDHDVEASEEVKARMEELTSVDIEGTMKTTFSDFKVYNYPCVSARIFSTMSLLYANNEDFRPILPLLTSLVNAEVVSLKSRDENRDVYFINKRVCFSGYDYSSTMPAVDSIDGSHVDLMSSIEALKEVLQEAQQIAQPAHYLDQAIGCLNDMGSCEHISDMCSQTLVGYFPSSRFRKAIKHYKNELMDLRCFLTKETPNQHESHVGVRFRLRDFIGRSIRFHLRAIMNSLPESIDFLLDGCEERWGRAVDDRSVSSILNFSLEKVNQFMIEKPKLFDDHEALPSFFTTEASQVILSCGKMEGVRSKANLKSIAQDALGDIIADVKEARTFLLGARACKFVWELLSWPGVKRHIRDVGGWEQIQCISQVFFDLKLYENSLHQHFILLRDVDNLIEMLRINVERFEYAIDACETAIRKLRRQMIQRQRDHSYKTKGTAMFALRMSLTAEEGERFPIPIANYNC